jgi:hypothetical protein
MNNRRRLVIPYRAGALANGFLVELMDWIPPDLFKHPPQCEDCWFRITVRPGHGMALAPSAREKH